MLHFANHARHCVGTICNTRGTQSSLIFTEAHLDNLFRSVDKLTGTPLATAFMLQSVSTRCGWCGADLSA